MDAKTCRERRLVFMPFGVLEGFPHLTRKMCIRDSCATWYIFHTVFLQHGMNQLFLIGKRCDHTDTFIGIIFDKLYEMCIRDRLFLPDFL